MFSKMIVTFQMKTKYMRPKFDDFKIKYEVVMYNFDNKETKRI